MTTKTGFNNEQFELSAADGDIPRLALQGVTEIQDFIEARTPTPEAVRHLADVLSKRLRLQHSPDTAAAAANSQHAAQVAPSAETSPRTHLHAIREGILNRLLPIGYQDEAGYHRGAMHEHPVNGNGHATPPAPPSA
jgi:hypothetical protein